MKGYGHPDYADSLAEFGVPRELPECGGWVLERPIPGCQQHDAMGCYPLFFCNDWSRLYSDLRSLEGKFVAVSMVTDPLGKYSESQLHQCFDVVIPFKKHFVTDLGVPIELVISKHHRRYLKKSLEKINVEVCTEPIRFLDEWTGLYGALADKFQARGVRAFSRKAFAKQLSIPGIVMFRALYQGDVVAAHLHYLQGSVCYGHLAGINAVGHELMASYALYSAVIKYFADKANSIVWGGSSGLKASGSDGLAQFKQGWSTGTKTSYFCGRILDKEKYAEIVSASGMEATNYFPAYRRGEFG